jgi:hypothetical protein
MLRHLIIAMSLLGGAGAASAEPLSLSDQQLDTITGGVIVGATFERVMQNGQRGFLVTLIDLDPDTGEVSTRQFGRTIPIPDRPTFGFDITIGSGG